jgi:hypothetical protein
MIESPREHQRTEEPLRPLDASRLIAECVDAVMLGRRAKLVHRPIMKLSDTFFTDTQFLAKFAERQSSLLVAKAKTSFDDHTLAIDEFTEKELDASLLILRGSDIQRRMARGTMLRVEYLLRASHEALVSRVR